MTALVWDEVGQRTFETGVDHGVLYVRNPDESQTVAPWNGLVSVVEHPGGSSKPYFIDGIKYMERFNPGDYSATLQAFTYPDLLDFLTGTPDFVPGLRIHDQRVKLFDFSYQTKIGNDLDGVDHGYKIHIIYNVLAVPSDYTYETLGRDPKVAPFQWELKGTPDAGWFGIRPTGHISVDSREIPAESLTLIETMLYGDADTDPNLPSLPDLLAIFGSPS
jgi:hypothetical protein